MRVAFDSRPVDGPARGRALSRCLLQALARPRSPATSCSKPTARAGRTPARVFHTPWMQGAMLHSPCPMVVTSTTWPRSAPQRAPAHGPAPAPAPAGGPAAARVIVPTQAVAEDAVEHLGLERERIVVIAEAADT